MESDVEVEEGYFSAILREGPAAMSCVNRPFGNKTASFKCEEP